MTYLILIAILFKIKKSSYFNLKIGGISVKITDDVSLGIG